MQAGLTGGVFNFCANVAGIPIIIGARVASSRWTSKPCLYGQHACDRHAVAKGNLQNTADCRMNAG
jgi:hypothetical protein